MPCGTNPGTKQSCLCHGFKLPLCKGLCLTGRCNKTHSCHEQSSDLRQCVSPGEGGKESRSWVGNGSHSSPRCSCACHGDSVREEAKWGHGCRSSGLRLQTENTFATGRKSREAIKSVRWCREASEIWCSLLYLVWVQKEKVGGCSHLVREKTHEVTVTVEMAGGTTARKNTTQESTEQPKSSKTPLPPISCSAPTLHLGCNHRVTFFGLQDKGEGGKEMKIQGAVLTEWE